MLRRDGRGVDNQRRRWFFTGCWDKFYILFIVNLHPFFLQCVCEIGWSFVISRHYQSFMKEIASYSTHTDATRTNEVN